MEDTWDSLKRPFLISNIVHYGTLASILVYMVLVEVLWTYVFEKEPIFDSDGSLMFAIRVMFYVWSLGNVVLTLLFLGKRFWSKLVEKVSPMSVAGLFVLGPFATLAVLYLLLSDRSDPSECIPDEKLQLAQGMISLLCEIAGTLGLLLFVFGGQRPDLYIICGAAVVAFIALRPRRNRWDSTFI